MSPLIEAAMKKCVDGLAAIDERENREREDRIRRNREEEERQRLESAARWQRKSAEMVARVVAAVKEVDDERYLETLVFTDPDLKLRFDHQVGIFNAAVGRNDHGRIVDAGAAMLRGVRLVRIAATRCHPGEPPIMKGADKAIQYRQRQSKEFKEWYALYLKSEDWGGRRTKVLERAQFLCEGCRDAKPTQVHHLTYDHVGDELLFELVAVCDDCHVRVHGRKGVA